MRLDINKLIKVAENVVYDNQIGMAAKISHLVHDLKIDDNIYELRVELKLKD